MGADSIDPGFEYLRLRYGDIVISSETYHSASIIIGHDGSITTISKSNATLNRKSMAKNNEWVRVRITFPSNPTTRIAHDSPIQSLAVKPL
jgi:hypothetical protein